MSNSIPDYGTRRTMWKHPDRIWAYFVTDMDRDNGYLTYLKMWEAVGGGYEARNEGIGVIHYQPKDVTFFAEPQLNRGHRR